MTHTRKAVLFKAAVMAVLAAASVGFAQSAPRSAAKSATVQGATAQDALAQGAIEDGIVRIERKFPAAGLEPSLERLNGHVAATQMVDGSSSSI